MSLPSALWTPCSSHYELLADAPPAPAPYSPASKPLCPLFPLSVEFFSVLWEAHLSKSWRCLPRPSSPSAHTHTTQKNSSFPPFCLAAFYYLIKVMDLGPVSPVGWKHLEVWCYEVWCGFISDSPGSSTVPGT